MKMKMVIWYTLGGVDVVENIVDIQGSPNGGYLELYTDNGPWTADVRTINLIDGSIENYQIKPMD